MKLLTILTAITFYLVSPVTVAECHYLWVDHDYNPSTPPIQKQVCESPIDLPALPDISTPPIQTPTVPPISSPYIPPIGNTSCRDELVYRDGEWVTEMVCY
jgi:hypothetical protein